MTLNIKKIFVNWELKINSYAGPTKSLIVSINRVIILYNEIIEKLRKERDDFFFHSGESPLPEELKKKYTQLPYFQINPAFRIKVNLDIRDKPKPTDVVNMVGKTETVDKVGKANFVIPNSSEPQTIEVYQNRLTKEYFIIFGDLTNQEGITYGAGRYVALEHDPNGEWIIDFNKAQSPYCSYSEKFPCPLTPRRNRLNIKVEAGEKYIGEH